MINKGNGKQCEKNMIKNMIKPDKNSDFWVKNKNIT